jgi:hypothetical protein
MRIRRTTDEDMAYVDATTVERLDILTVRSLIAGPRGWEHLRRLGDERDVETVLRDIDLVLNHIQRVITP